MSETPETVSIVAATKLAKAAAENVLTNLTSQTTSITSPPSSELQLSNIFTDEVSQTKLLASLILFLITLLCGYLPVRILLNQNYIQYAMFAGGGVLMATAFCHLIPEAHENFKSVSSAESLMRINKSLEEFNVNNKTNGSLVFHQPAQGAGLGKEELLLAENGSQPLNIPYLEITLCCGFFFMYVVEQMMVRFINNHSHEPAVCGSGSEDNIGATSVNLSSVQSVNTTTAIVSSSDRNLNLTNQSSSSSSVSLSNGSSEFYKFMRGLLIVSAFGAHSIFDGVAIGSQTSSESVWTLFLAISCHKLIIAAVVGLELYSATLESHFWTLVHLSIFSIMSPIGIILVVIAQSSLQINSNHPTMILLQSFATGTLLYIVFVEILQPKESRTYEKNNFGKSFSLIVGFSIMVMVLTLIDE